MQNGIRTKPDIRAVITFKMKFLNSLSCKCQVYSDRRSARTLSLF